MQDPLSFPAWLGEGAGDTGSCRGRPLLPWANLGAGRGSLTTPRGRDHHPKDSLNCSQPCQRLEESTGVLQEMQRSRGAISEGPGGCGCGPGPSFLLVLLVPIQEGDPRPQVQCTTLPLPPQSLNECASPARASARPHRRVAIEAGMSRARPFPKDLGGAPRSGHAHARRIQPGRGRRGSRDKKRGRHEAGEGAAARARPEAGAGEEGLAG